MCKAAKCRAMSWTSLEAYGGEGPGHPDAFDTYMICPHAWDQGDMGKALEKKAFAAMHNPVRMGKLGIPSAWYETFHVYGCKITKTDTIYYCDNIEVGRHATLPLSKQERFFFLINLATGGGWPVDLSRYDGQADCMSITCGSIAARLWAASDTCPSPVVPSRSTPMPRCV